MNTTSTFSVARANGRTLLRGMRSTHARRVAVTLITALLALVITLQQLSMAATPVYAAGPDVLSLYAMVQQGEGPAALQQVVAEGTQRGGWTAAPGDVVVFDPYMSRDVRGAMQDFDEMPYDCSDPKVAVDEAACLQDFLIREQQVRFGPSLFSTPMGDGTVEPRPAFDDLLSTYIEEVGHSWQEYLYETEGRGNGDRTRQTTLEESEYWAAGREYQIKRYILSLDGTVLDLSGDQRENLRGQICEGYANPLGHQVPAFGAPPGWPNADGWPTTDPTPDEWAAFCANS